MCGIVNIAFFCLVKIHGVIHFLKALFIFRERGREGEREGEKHRCVRETLIGYFSHIPKQGHGL